MKSFGSPFQSGTLANIFLGVIILTSWLYLFVSGGYEKPYLFLIMGLLGLGGLSRSLFKYRKLKVQQGIELLDDKN
ncbi:MAG: hypothetical protein O3B41_06745 [Bacteroidetes bacterium]|nr:hypothetical protein [Bacteroidota bacterium]